jgi:hypothetical protein
MSLPMVLFVAAAVQAAPTSNEPARLTRPVRFTLANTSGHVIHAVYISPVESAKWGPNLIKAPLARGQAAPLSLAGGCGRYDVRMVADKRTELFEDDVEFCEDGHQLQVMETQLEKKKVR